ncbi:MAG TPA: hypothetical protein VFQ61_33205 [Polyangiaceae bacterium]|nr:hypothetical protein [Polyangiaceae bacterium]
MSKPEFVVPVADLEAGPRQVSWAIPLAWLEQTFEGTQATARAPGRLEVELSKSGREVMVRGRVEVQVTMPCVVTLDPLDFDLQPEVFLMLSPAKEPHGGGRERQKGRVAGASGPGAPTPRGEQGAALRVVKGGKAAGPTTAKSAARPGKPGNERPGKPASGWADDPELSESDAARDTFDGERVVLDDFVREFLVLELPMYPRRSDLPREESAAIAPASPSSGSASSSIDPRLLPLAELANRLREKKKE